SLDIPGEALSPDTSHRPIPHSQERNDQREGPMHTTRTPTGTRRALLLWLLAAGATLLPRAGFAQQCTLGSFATVACTRLLERTLVLRADRLTPLDGLSTARTRQVMGATAEAAHDP